MSRVGLRLTLAHSLALALSSATLAATLAGCGEEEPAVDRSDDNADEGDEQPSDKDEGDKRQEPKKDAGLTKPKDAGKPTSSTPTDNKPSSGGADAGTQPAKPGTDTAVAATEECKALELAKKKCAGCHDGEGTAATPMGLTSFEDFAKDAPKASGKVHAVSKERINSTDPKKMMPPSGLETADKAILDKWLAAGAPAGADATCGGDKPDEPTDEPVWPPPGATDCAKLVANGPNSTVKKGTEPHPQFIFDAPWGDKKVQAIGFRPITDNKKVIHHWILYPNTGGSGGMLTGWAPGGEKSDESLPDDVGVWMPSGPKSLRLDVHHNNLNGTQDEVDRSGVEVCWTTDLRKYESSTFMQFAGIPSIPAGQTKDVIGTCTVQADGPVYLMSVSPHAHTLATHMKFDVKKKDGTMVNLYDAPFNFEEQLSKKLKEPFLLETGDQVITNCTFKNTTNRTVGFGENTGNEMCFNFATYYPNGKLSCGLGGLPGVNLGDLFGGR